MIKHIPIPENNINLKEAKKEKKKAKKLSKQTINVYRTTQRNNIDLTAIADNKASVLLSLNALMITFLAPMVIAYSDFILEQQLGLSLLILCVTCLMTIGIAAQVLKPSHFDKVSKYTGTKQQPSPFFFGNFYKMNAEEFLEYTKDALGKPELLKLHLAQDLFFVGKRLGDKMYWIRLAFNIFTVGVFLTLLTALVAVFVF